MKHKIKIVILNVLVILAFLSSHFIQAMDYVWKIVMQNPFIIIKPITFFGLRVGIIVDILLWSGIIIQLIGIVLLLKEVRR